MKKVEARPREGKANVFAWAVGGVVLVCIIVAMVGCRAEKATTFSAPTAPPGPVTRNTTTEPFPLVGWSTWGGLQIKALVTSKQTVTFTGAIDSSAGYAIERRIPIGGSEITFAIRGVSSCTFDGFRLFKFEVNGKALRPTSVASQNLMDADYINASDGDVTFVLPNDVRKMEFVFYKANLGELTISGYMTHPQK